MAFLNLLLDGNNLEVKLLINHECNSTLSEILNHTFSVQICYIRFCKSWF
jgi:hypothetical protein